MGARKKQNNVEEENTSRELAGIDKLMQELESDNSLPTFPDHIIKCMFLGIAENVNLKQMYPKTYFKVIKWLEKHNRNIIAWQKKHRK